MVDDILQRIKLTHQQSTSQFTFNWNLNCDSNVSEYICVEFRARLTINSALGHIGCTHSCFPILKLCRSNKGYTILNCIRNS